MGLVFVYLPASTLNGIAIYAAICGKLLMVAAEASGLKKVHDS